MDIKSINLFNKTSISWVTIKDLVNMPTAMPENEAAFVYILKGACINYSETQELKLGINQGVLAKCGNSTFKTLPVKGDPEYSAISIRFHKDILEKIYHDSQPPFLSKTKIPLTSNSVLIESSELIKQYINSFIYYFNHQELLTEDILILKIKELILILLQMDDAPIVQEIMNNLFATKTFEFKEIIKAHICTSISIEELASLTNSSLSTFKKEFKRIYNDTPNNYIINKRIEKVAQLLPVSNETISNIAFDCEFKTLAHMSRVFKSKYGVSPSVYRKIFLDN